jgi:hypothetical protein
MLVNDITFHFCLRFEIKEFLQLLRSFFFKKQNSATAGAKESANPNALLELSGKPNPGIVLALSIEPNWGSTCQGKTSPDPLLDLVGGPGLKL